MSGEILVLILIVINIFIFVLPRLVKFGDGLIDSASYFMSLGWKDNRAIKDGEYYRLITSTFLHSGLLHLFFNMYFLFNLGPDVVTIFESQNFLVIYFISGFFASLTSFLFNKFPSVGASGSLFGLLGAVLAFSVVAKDQYLAQSIMFTITLNFGIFLLFGKNMRIDNWGHIGGLIAGFLTSLLIIYV